MLLSSPSSSQYCPAIVITYTNRFFYENAIGIKQAIEQVIISLFPDTFNTLTISVWPDMTLGLLLPLDHCPIPPLQISIAPHEDTLLLRNYVVFNMEQLWSPYMKNERYLTILREARAVWTFSSQHLEYLLSIGINAENIWFLPIYTDQRYLLSTYQLYTSTTTTTTSTSSGTVSENPLSAFPQKDFDVLVFGSFSIRRNDIVQEMLRNISQYTSSFDFYRVLSGVQYSLMRDRRDDYVRRSKVMSILSSSSYQYLILFFLLRRLC